jgi:hypothetical protein
MKRAPDSRAMFCRGDLESVTVKKSGAVWQFYTGAEGAGRHPCQGNDNVEFPVQCTRYGVPVL